MRRSHDAAVALRGESYERRALAHSSCVTTRKLSRSTGQLRRSWMSIRERVDALVREVEAGRFVEAIDANYADDASSHESTGINTTGKPALLAKERTFLTTVEEVGCHRGGQCARRRPDGGHPLEVRAHDRGETHQDGRGRAAALERRWRDSRASCASNTSRFRREARLGDPAVPLSELRAALSSDPPCRDARSLHR